MIELPVRVGIRVIALARLDDALAARERLAHARDDESLHDFRVALRRLRSGLRAYRPWFDDTVTRSDRRALKQLARATGAARDVEVHLKWLGTADIAADAAAGADMLRRHLERSRKAADRTALRAAHRFPALADRLRDRFRRYTGEVDRLRPFAAVTTGTVTAGLASGHFAGFEADVGRLRDDDSAAVAHRARIQGKRLRYLIEPFADDVDDVPDTLETLKAVQDDLGQLHDLDVLIALTADRGAAADSEAVALAPFAAFLRDRRARRLADIRSSHLDGAVAELGDRVERLASALRSAGDTADVEIERKYLLNGLPRRRTGRTVVRIDQGWLPGDRIVERVRRIRDGDETRYVRTIKFGRGLVRREVEDEIDEDTFRRMWPLTKGLRISKRRYSFRDGARVWTVDRFTDRDLILAEIELDSPDDDVEPPDWLAPWIEREVTGLAGYQNVHLAALAGAPDRDA